MEIEKRDLEMLVFVAATALVFAFRTRTHFHGWKTDLIMPTLRLWLHVYLPCLGLILSWFPSPQSKNMLWPVLLDIFQRAGDVLQDSSLNTKRQKRQSRDLHQPLSFQAVRRQTNELSKKASQVAEGVTNIVGREENECWHGGWRSQTQDRRSTVVVWTTTWCTL